ncbi:MAG: hypothetical protein KDC38_08365 [Planctomycetes bacterium]|nr:hypothetical protein [Planctomycetota bacterium]
MQKLLLGLVLSLAWIGTVDAVPFTRGDVNGDGLFDIGDAVAGLDHLFGGATLACDDALDANDDGGKDIGDAVSILATLFSGGSPPPAPFPDCGEDPTADALTCDVYDACGGCVEDAYEPNEFQSQCAQLGAIDDTTPFPAGT